MSNTKGIAQAREVGAEGEERTCKALAHVPAGEGTRSLWVFGELVTHKIPSRRTGGERTVMAQAGSLIYVPKGSLHAHNGVGEGKGRMLVTQTPGGLYERFFEELGKEADGDDVQPPPVFEGRPGARKIIAVAARYGIEIPPANSKEF